MTNDRCRITIVVAWIGLITVWSIWLTELHVWAFLCRIMTTFPNYHQMEFCKRSSFCGVLISTIFAVDRKLRKIVPTKFIFNIIYCWAFYFWNHENWYMFTRENPQKLSTMKINIFTVVIIHSTFITWI